MARSPMKDQIAIVGVGSTGFSRGDRSPLSLALQAATAAIRDAVELDFLDRGGVPIVAFRLNRSHQPNRPSRPSQPSRPNHATEPSHATEPGRATRRDHRSRD